MKPCWPTPSQEVTGRFGSISCGFTAPFLWFLVLTGFYLCPPSLESLLPPVLWKSCNHIPLCFKVRFPGDSQSLCWVPRLGSVTWGSESSQQWENFFGTIVLQFVGHEFVAGMAFDFIVIVPLLPSLCGLFFVLGHGIYFLGWFQILLSKTVQQLVVILLFLQEEMSAHHSTPPSLTRSSEFTYFYETESMGIISFSTLSW